METQSGDRNFIQSFVTQADISRLSSDCDLVPDVLRISNFSKKQSMKSTQCHLSSDVTFRPEQRMRRVLNLLSNRCLISQMNKLLEAFTDPRNLLDQGEKVQRLDEHLSSDSRYNPFCLVNMSDDDKSHLSSFFTSIQDKFRYQACDRSGTFSSETHDIFAKLIYDNEEYRSHHLYHPFGNHDVQCNDPVWREQFDHASKDFLSSLGHNSYEYMMNELKSECLTRVQKW